MNLTTAEPKPEAEITDEALQRQPGASKAPRKKRRRKAESDRRGRKKGMLKAEDVTEDVTEDMMKPRVAERKDNETILGKRKNERKERLSQRKASAVRLVTKPPRLVTFPMFRCPLIRAGIFHLSRRERKEKDKQQKAALPPLGGKPHFRPNPTSHTGAGVRRVCWVHAPVNASYYGCQHLFAGLKKKF